MADEHDKHHEDKPAIVLIARMRAHLVGGEEFELLPIRHERDVKSEVDALLKSWAESGFLMRGRFVYPWHQVRQVEVTSVEEVPAELAHQQDDELLAAERARTQEDFWRTRPDPKAEKEKK